MTTEPVWTEETQHENAVAPHGPILVTGMPRSGTTWLARLLATAPGTALPGREPMNPRGRQYALGSTLRGWTSLQEPSVAQRVRLRTAYAGWNPSVFSRYGRRQWAAPLPWVRVVVKDPFAMLSLPEIVRSTGASVVNVFRHPAAGLFSYRQMGWEPDLDEIAPVLEAHRRLRSADEPESVPRAGDVDQVEAMARFWSALHEVALDMAEAAGIRPLVVAHEELAQGGTEAAQRLFDALGLRWSSESTAEMTRRTSKPREEQPGTLHHFDRAPTEAASRWRTHVSPEEVERIEALTQPVRMRLDEHRLRLTR
jgi:Sulfotransferase family